MNNFHARHHHQVPQSTSKRSFLNNHGPRVYHDHLLPRKNITKFKPAKPLEHFSDPSRPKLNQIKLSLLPSSSSCHVCKKSFPSTKHLYGHMMRLHPERALEVKYQSKSSDDERGVKRVLPPPPAPKMVKSVGSPSSSPKSTDDQRTPKSTDDKRTMKYMDRKDVLASVMKNFGPSQNRKSSDERAMKSTKDVLAPVMKNVVPFQSRFSDSSEESGRKGVLPLPRAPPVMKSVDQSPSPSISESSDVTESEYDTVRFLPSWGKKDQRGRALSIPSARTTSEPVILTQQKPYEILKEIKSSGNIVSTTKTSDALKSNKQLTPIETWEAIKRSIISPEIVWIGSDITSSKKKKKRRRMKSHTCEICNKEFETGPALGGHKRIHNNNNSAVAAPGTELVVASELIASETADHTHTRQQKASVTKRMDEIEEGEIIEEDDIIEEGEITDEEVSHRVSRKDEEGSHTVITVSRKDEEECHMTSQKDQEKSNGVTRMILDFDLNELPSED